MTFQQLLPDNPILVKHVRSRLRRQQLFPSMAATALLCAMILWIGIAASSVQNGIAFGFLVFFQAGLLFLGGASQVGTSVAGAREAGVLDFHRISPVPPAALALGFLLGGPVREYVLFLCTLPFAIAFVALGWPSPLGFLELYFGFLI